MQPDVSFFLDIKEVSDQGTFQGVASVYGVEDLGGDVIDKGAFKKTLSENANVPVLWQHMSSEVIGSGVVKEWQNKILIDGQLDMEDPTAQKAFRKLKQKLVKGLSIGFNTVKSTWEEIEQDGARKFIRHIQELKLWEVSVVTFPMLPAAQVTRVKSNEDYEALRAQIESLQNEVKALRAAQVTPQPGADEGKGAAENDSEPDAHSDVLLIQQFGISILGELNG